MLNIGEGMVGIRGTIRQLSQLDGYFTGILDMCLLVISDRLE